MSNWIGDSGNTSSAGEWDAGVPDSTHDAIFNAGSFSTTGLTVTVDAALSCKDMTWTGATNSPTLALGANNLFINGDATFIAAMVQTGAGIYFDGASATCKLTTNGLTLVRVSTRALFTGTLTLQDNLTTSDALGLLHAKGTINTGNKNITCNIFRLTGASAKTLTLGSSIVTCSAWDDVSTGTSVTLTANTATINCSGSFAGGSIATYHIVNLTGATSTVSGNNTFNTLDLPSGTTGTYTITDGSTQSAKNFFLSGDAKHTHTITGTAAAGYTLTATGGGTVYMDYVNMSYCTATGATFLYGPHCTMTSCTGWKPAPRYAGMMGRRF